MDKRLITSVDIARYRPVSKDIPKDRIDPFIMEAQSIDLQAVLGDVLYYDFFLRFDNTLDAKYDVYQELLIGKSYTPPGGTGNIEYEGLKPMLVYFSVARFYENNQLNTTRYGIVNKLNEFSEPVSQSALSGAINAVRAMGIAYQEKVRKFLSDNQSSYELFNQGRKQDLNSVGVKFFDL